MTFKYTFTVLAFILMYSCKTSQSTETSDLSKFGVEETEEGFQSLKVGDLAPDIKHGEFQLKQELQSNKLVIVFYRGYWCGYCNKHIAKLEKSLEEIKSKGANVWLITPEKQEFAAKGKAENISVISDSTQQIMKDYGVYFDVTDAYVKKVDRLLGVDLEQNNGAEALPIPATFIINQEQKIDYVHFDPDYSQRSTIEDILENL